MNHNQLRSFLHPILTETLNRHFSRAKPKLRVVVLHDNVGAVYYALRALGVDIDEYWCWNRWDEMNELNADIKLIKNVDQWSEEKWAKLSPVHLLISALPMKHVKFKTDAAGCITQPSGRQVGRRTYPERGLLGACWVYIQNHGRKVKLNQRFDDFSDGMKWLQNWTSLLKKNFSLQIQGKLSSISMTSKI